MGDLILAARLVEGLRNHNPGGRVLFVVRKPFAQVSQLFPDPPDEVLTLDFEPHHQSVPTEALREQLQLLVKVIQDRQPDTLVAADLEPSWLSWFLISQFPQSQVVALTSSQPKHGLLPLLIQKFGGKTRGFEGPAYQLDMQANMHENQRYNAILEYLGCLPPDSKPWPKPTADSELFAQIGVQAGKYIACFPTGAASTLVKRWSQANYAEVLTGTLTEDCKLLLTGEVSERDALLAFRDAFGTEAQHIRIFTGSAQDIGKLAMLLANAQKYIGSDTGPAHLAQAYGIPGVVVFGGGTWPHYAPWGNGSVGVVQRLGCFGCGWDCAFGKAYCLETLPVEKVRQAFISAGTFPTGPSLLEVEAPAEFDHTFLKTTAASYRSAQANRANRFEAAIEMEGSLQFPVWPQPFRAHEDKMDQLEAVLQSQLKALQSVDKALRAFLPEAGGTVSGYDDLEAALVSKLNRDREFARDSMERLANMQTLSTQLAAMTTAAQERLALIEKSGAESQMYQVALADAREQLSAAGQREKDHAARIELMKEEEQALHVELSKFRSETLMDAIMRKWKLR